MDAQIGQVPNELERLGMSDNTIIVLWGDHGWHLAEKGIWGKGTTFKVSSRGPVIIADPRIKTAGLHLVCHLGSLPLGGVVFPEPDNWRF